MPPSTQSVQPDSTKAAKTDSMVTSPPDWDKVLFAVSCARCGQDLHGLTEPVCPACKLEFDWAEAVPIEQLICESCDYHLYGLTETRCPECGTPFTWEGALTNYHRTKNPLFEYQWRNRPIRSLVGTWLRALRPGRFWRSVELHHPPRIVPLLLYVFSSILVVIATGPFLMLVAGFMSWILATPSGSVLTWSLLMVGVLSAFMKMIGFALAYLIWLALSFGSLIIYRQSMRIFQVKTVHIVRVWAYTIPTMFPVSLCLSIIIITFTWRRRIAVSNILIPICLYLIFSIWTIRQGFRHYLRIPHSLGIAVTSQLIALLLGGFIELWLTPNRPNALFYQLLEFLHLI